MKHIHRRRPIATLATIAACATTMLLGGAASAQISEDLVPPVLDMIDDVTGVTPTPLPTEKNGDIVDGVGGTVGDTIDDALGTLNQDPGGGAVPGPSRSDDPDATEDDQTDGGSDPAGDGAPGASGGGAGQGGAGDGTSDGSSSGSDTLAAEAGASYGSTSARAALATATRAIKLAGPLAAPLLFGVLAVVGLIGLGRGSDGMLKIERAREAGRVYRL